MDGSSVDWKLCSVIWTAYDEPAGAPAGAAAGATVARPERSNAPGRENGCWLIPPILDFARTSPDATGCDGPAVAGWGHETLSGSRGDRHGHHQHPDRHC